MTNKSTVIDNEIETRLLELWSRMLDRPDLTVDDDFFDFGGDSLLATEMLLQLGNLTSEVVPVSVLMETGSVRTFAAHLRAQREKQ